MAIHFGSSSMNVRRRLHYVCETKKKRRKENGRKLGMRVKYHVC